MSPLAALVRKEVRVELRSLQDTVAAAMLVLAFQCDLPLFTPLRSASEKWDTSYSRMV